MKQAGLKPQNHSSGVYWVRASRDNQGPQERQNLNILLWTLILLINFVLLLLEVVKKVFSLKRE